MEGDCPASPETKQSPGSVRPPDGQNGMQLRGWTFDTGMHEAESLSITANMYISEGSNGEPVIAEQHPSETRPGASSRQGRPLKPNRN